jgi:UMF1 family MFS transporter
MLGFLWLGQLCLQSCNCNSSIPYLLWKLWWYNDVVHLFSSEFNNLTIVLFLYPFSFWLYFSVTHLELQITVAIRSALCNFSVIWGRLGNEFVFFYGSDLMDWNFRYHCRVLVLGSIVFYNSYLPEIAHPEQHDRSAPKDSCLVMHRSLILLVLI